VLFVCLFIYSLSKIYRPMATGRKNLEKDVKIEEIGVNPQQEQPQQPQKPDVDTLPEKLKDDEAIAIALKQVQSKA
jgi:hypothetical protein